MPIRLRHLIAGLFLTVPGIIHYRCGVATADSSQVRYVGKDGAIADPLTSTAGSPERGKQIVLDRARGDCVVCHALSLPDSQFHGNVGPPLDGVGARHSAGALRLRVVDPKVVNPQSAMPAYHKGSGLSKVLRRLRGKPILSVQEVEDVVAYLVTLKSAPLVSETNDTTKSSALPIPSRPPYRVEERRSGYTYLSPENQQLQNDEFANPGMLWVERGKELWRKSEGNAGKSCANCHAEAGSSMRGVSLRFPRFDPRRKKLTNVEQQINRCREEHMRATPYEYESEALLSLTAFVAFQSRGLPIAVQVGQLSKPFLAAGRKFFMQRRGQLDLACAHCHDQLAGRRLRGEVISQGHVNGFPVYRQLWQTLGSSHHMFAWCNLAIRAEPFPPGSDEYVNLELYMNWRARGLAVESPAVRR